MRPADGSISVPVALQLPSEPSVRGRQAIKHSVYLISCFTSDQEQTASRSMLEESSL